MNSPLSHAVHAGGGQRGALVEQSFNDAGGPSTVTSGPRGKHGSYQHHLQPSGAHDETNGSSAVCGADDETNGSSAVCGVSDESNRFQCCLWGR